MASIYDVKPQFQALLRPLANFLAKAHVTANIVTMSAMILSVGVGALVGLEKNKTWVMFLIPAFLFVRMALNAIDGMLAKEHNMKSKKGLILNEMGDVVSDASLYLPLSLVWGVKPMLAGGFVALALMTEMAGVLGFVVSEVRRYDGPLGKSDRAFLFGLLALFAGFKISFESWVNPLFMFFCGLEIVTILRRTRRALK